MDLILWLHADAEEGFPDLARQLTRKGHDQAAKMAGWLKTQIPDPSELTLLVSPATRARQTAEAFSHEFEIVHEVGLGASVNQILVAANWPYAKGTVIVVGHQPTLGEVAQILQPDIPPGLSFRKGSVWWFQYRKKNAAAETVLHTVKYPESL